MYLGSLFSAQLEQFRFICTAIPLLFHLVTATADAFIISWDELFSPCRLQSMPFAIRYSVTTVSTSQSSSNGGQQEFASVLQTDDNSLTPDMSSKQDVPRCFSYKYICHLNLFSYLPSHVTPKKHKTTFPE